MTQLTTSAPTASQPTSAGSSMALLGATVAGAALLAATPRRAAAVTPALTFEANIPGTGDIKVLNFALALEALEADLYVQALMRLTTGGTNGLGQQITGLNITQGSPDYIAVQYIQEFATVEADHRNYLEQKLGAQAITQSALKGANFDFGFSNANTATVNYVVQVVLSAEALGVQAYLGAIPFFASYTYLQVAAAILGTEARHTAAIAIVQNTLNNTSNETAPQYNENGGRDKPMTPDQVLAQVSPFIVLAKGA